MKWFGAFLILYFLSSAMLEVWLGLSLPPPHALLPISPIKKGLSIFFTERTGSSGRGTGRPGSGVLMILSSTTNLVVHKFSFWRRNQRGNAMAIIFKNIVQKENLSTCTANGWGTVYLWFTQIHT